MSVDNIIKHVESLSQGRTRYEGQKWFTDEVLVAEIKRLRAELDAAKAVIEKLPKTADGVAIAPGDKVYIRSRYEDGVECMVAYIEAANLRRQVAGDFSGCYSTREAALAAKENPNATT